MFKQIPNQRREFRFGTAHASRLFRPRVLVRLLCVSREVAECADHPSDSRSRGIEDVESREHHLQEGHSRFQGMRFSYGRLGWCVGERHWARWLMGFFMHESILPDHFTSRYHEGTGGIPGRSWDLLDRKGCRSTRGVAKDGVS